MLLNYRSAMGVCLAALSVLVSCSSPPQAPPPGTRMPQPPRGAVVYRIDAAASELRLRVYKAGTLARLGHNHLILNRQLAGWVGTTSTQTSFWLEVPTGGFVVDDSDARAAAGPDFAAEVPDDAKAGTLHNMLSAALLDAQRYPDISVQSLRVETAPVAGSDAMALPLGQSIAQEPALQGSATVSIRVAGRPSTVVVPFTVQRGAGRVSATGAVTLRQSGLGLTPFSVMLGALQVRDEFELQFTLVARTP